MHPRLRDGVSLGAFQKESSEHYYVENEWEERFEISYWVYRELMHADGTHPVRLSNSLVDKLKKEKILTASRFVFEGIISRFILITFGKNLARFQPICRWINVVLPLLAVSLFAVSVSVKQTHDYSGSSDLNYILYYMLIIFSLLVHEVGHLVSGIAYGYRFKQLGMLLLGILPIGAYVSYEDKKELNRLSQVQFSLAGIEANVLMAAVCLSQTWPQTSRPGFLKSSRFPLVVCGTNLMQSPQRTRGTLCRAMTRSHCIVPFSSRIIHRGS